ncbi:MAG: DUF2975 domain-containing protein [Oscillospiraceae bacterium]
MKILHKLLNQNLAMGTAKFMKAICYITIFLFVTMLVLCSAGRLEYNLKVGDKTYAHAIYAEENHDFSSRSLTVKSKDSLSIRAAADDGTIDIITYAAISIMFAINIIPLMFAYWFLSKIFDNVAKGEIFVLQNANFLLYYGIIQSSVAIIVPFIKLFIVLIANTLVADSISMSTGGNMLNQLVLSSAFLVAAYIISYGVHLQDEADHTL